ncbi:MAG: carboxymuconolactone decarboxylase family protein [Ignavibacteriaceae bacterium]|nr:carboxymuconolactone decarboxylase family protein [Ignavibacteriaceae bacterium]
MKDLIVQAKARKLPFKKIYEALLQNYLFTGYPSALLSLKLLKELYPNKRIPKAADMNLYHFRKRGEANCKKVYGNKFEKLISNVKNFSPDMAEWLVLEGYGKVLGRKGLSLKERELCIVATLAVLKFEDQLYSHINGAFRAKASIKEIRSVIDSLTLIGNKNLSAFGLRVLNRYIKEKGMHTKRIPLKRL